MKKTKLDVRIEEYMQQIEDATVEQESTPAQNTEQMTVVDETETGTKPSH